ncbi:MAG: alpha-ketoacid dehydrogenase subunit beta [Nitrospiraceae bacterium]|nr:MAG: alpha-ketoacid dehydrogenase subunit beta [Nitrospiraceae bacterium]
MRRISYLKAINEAIQEEMERDNNVFVIGEDVGEYGGVWGALRGIYEKYGAMRAQDTPISESGIIGLATGAAMAGLRPVAEIMYMDFLTTCMDPVVNQAAKADLMSGWQLKIPMVIRTQYGIGTREASQHSQSLEAWFMHTPGLKVVVPSNPYDAKGLLKASIRDDTPVIFMENRLLYNDIQDVPEGTWEIPLGKAKIVHEGEQITIVSYGHALKKVINALNEFNEISAELIDLRTLVPMDIDTIIESVKKTGRILIAHDAVEKCGAGAEIVRLVIEKAFDYLDAEPLVCGGLGVPTPFSGKLEDICMLRTEAIVGKIQYLLTGII